MGVLIKNKINYTGSGDILNQPVIYSDSERCIGVWRDGKPLYQKTWNFTEGQVFPVRDTWFDTNIEAEYIDKIIFASGYRSDSNYVGIIGAGLNQSNHIVLMQGRDNNFGNFKGFTLQYTKTTDTAGTGPWVPTGATPIHYSLEEQVIGTWIDGKPLYQKTITKSYDELTTYGVRKGFGLGEANAVLHNVEAYAYSPTYGPCFLGCKNYESDTSSSGYMECNMYYRIVVVGHSGGLSTLNENTHRPSLTATIQYTKTTD